MNSDLNNNAFNNQPQADYPGVVPSSMPTSEPIVQPVPVITQEPVVTQQSIVQSESVVTPQPMPTPVMEQPPVVAPQPVVQPQPVVAPAPAPVVEQSVVQPSVAPQPVIPEQNAGNNSVFDNPKPKKSTGKKVLIIVLSIVGAIILVAIIAFAIFALSNNDNYVAMAETTSTFEEVSGKYVLKNKDGKIVADNIYSHGKFCNGTTEVRNIDKQYGIIDQNGKMIVNYGKYSDIDQLSSWGISYYCFYEVEDSNNQKAYLSYDGKVIYYDKNNPKLSKVSLFYYYDTDRINFIRTENKYIYYSFNGDLIVEYNRKSQDNSDEPDLYMKYDTLPNGSSQEKSTIATIIFDGKTDIINLNNFKIIRKGLEGEFKPYEVSASESSLTILGVTKKNIETNYIIRGEITKNGKKVNRFIVFINDNFAFETDDCDSMKFDWDFAVCNKYNSSPIYYNQKGKQVSEQELNEFRKNIKTVS